MPNKETKQTLRADHVSFRYAKNLPVILNDVSLEIARGERVGIARVLGPETQFLVCDEITTMLDVITQSQIWRLLLEVAEERELGMLIITHNMALADQVCTRVIHLPDINHPEGVEE
jgi:peptide/nickel transport system ATP-binding protein